MKILAIQFQYLGDAVFMTPALQEIKNFYQNAELHVLVATEVFPILKHVNFIDKLWGANRVRGQLNIISQIPLILNLRKERFDRIVDFGGNDRGAFYSFLFLLFFVSIFGMSKVMTMYGEDVVSSSNASESWDE